MPQGVYHNFSPTAEAEKLIALIYRSVKFEYV
jgi:hypothetical protein